MKEYRSLEELMDGFKDEMTKACNKFEDRVLEEFNIENKEKINFLENHMNAIKNGEYEPKPFDRAK